MPGSALELNAQFRPPSLDTLHPVLRRRHFFNKRVSIVNYVTPEARPEEMLVDDSAGATVKQLGDALTEIEVNGHFFGNCSVTLVLHGDDPRALQQQTAEAQKAITELNEYQLGGRNLTVNEARPKPERSGGYGGGQSRRRRSEPRW